MRIFYHNDLDGRCAGAITLREALKYPVPGPGDVGLIEVDYKDKIDVGKILVGERIFVVDFSFKPEVMNEILRKTLEIVWLDHHKTAFEYQYDYEIGGIRDENYAGCELTWLFFHKKKPMPRAVVLIGDYDKWALKFQPSCFEFYEGLKMEDTNPKSELWDVLLGKIVPMADDLESRILQQGKSAIKYRNNYCAKICHDFGYEIDWEGHKAFATNFYQFGSKGFGDKMEQYDFCIAYIHDGQRFTISLYSIKGVDVSEICKKYGGGGHKGAAGFVTDKVPFQKEGK